jgi:hypothetical protein
LISANKKIIIRDIKRSGIEEANEGGGKQRHGGTKMVEATLWGIAVGLTYMGYKLITEDNSW